MTGINAFDELRFYKGHMMNDPAPTRHRLAHPVVVAIGVAAAILLLFLVGRPAAAQEEAWQIALRQQLKAEQGCDLAFIVNQKEFKLGDSVKLEDGLRCADGREYDFTRDRPHQKFTVKLCQPSYC